ncbi:hypothetical protein HDV02_000450 [Globomyces sp. JEL0801]|nr:hypothetical protein HDV02_000450 [Globomyces sp. JEL0801]
MLRAIRSLPHLSFGQKKKHECTVASCTMSLQLTLNAQERSMILVPKENEHHNFSSFFIQSVKTSSDQKEFLFAELNNNQTINYSILKKTSTEIEFRPTGSQYNPSFTLKRIGKEYQITIGRSTLTWKPKQFEDGYVCTLHRHILAQANFESDDDLGSIQVFPEGRVHDTFLIPTALMILYNHHFHH